MTLSWESLDFLPRLIDSTLTWADTFYILDTGSTDGSREYLRDLALNEPRIRFSVIDTDHTNFNRGRCINLILDQIDHDRDDSDWLAVLDCDEIFEEQFVSLALPVIRGLPQLYTEVSFQRPTLWYSDSWARAHDISFREPAFQRYRGGFRYPEDVFHMSRSMYKLRVTFRSRALLYNYELRDPKRSLLQFERLRLIDQEWNHLLREPSDPPELIEVSSLSKRGGEHAPTKLNSSANFLRAVIAALPLVSRLRGSVKFRYHMYKTKLARRK